MAPYGNLKLSSSATPTAQVTRPQTLHRTPLHPDTEQATWRQPEPTPKLSTNKSCDIRPRTALLLSRSAQILRTSSSEKVPRTFNHKRVAASGVRRHIPQTGHNASSSCKPFVNFLGSQRFTYGPMHAWRSSHLALVLFALVQLSFYQKSKVSPWHLQSPKFPRLQCLSQFLDIQGSIASCIIGLECLEGWQFNSLQQLWTIQNSNW